MSAAHDFGALEELERDGVLLRRIGGREIGVLLVDGEPRAVRNRCPHHGGPLCLGTVRVRESGSPSRYEPGTVTALRCPWHGWEFDLETGRCLDDPALRVAVYRAEARDGRVFVEA